MGPKERGTAVSLSVTDEQLEELKTLSCVREVLVAPTVRGSVAEMKMQTIALVFHTNKLEEHMFKLKQMNIRIMGNLSHDDICALSVDVSPSQVEWLKGMSGWIKEIQYAPIIQGC